MTNEDIDKKLEDIESRYYKGHKATSTEIADWWSKEDQKEYKRLLKLKERKPMKKFRVIVWEECTWEKIIEAEDESEIQAIAYEDIAETGYDNWEIGNHGTNDITDIQEVKND